jgi:hypothetical protein
MSKDLYIAELERIMAELLEQGYSEDAAYERAGDLAYDAVREKLADLGYVERKRRREDG